MLYMTAELRQLILNSMLHQNRSGPGIDGAVGVDPSPVTWQPEHSVFAWTLSKPCYLARFVRERGHRVVCALLAVCDEDMLHDLAPAIAGRLADGLNDSWSHVSKPP
jgi:hypothetical protein